MTVIIHTNAFNVPVLISDMLISGPEGDQAPIKLPTHAEGIDEVFPEGSGYIPKNLRRKVFIINDNMAVGTSGSLVHMSAFIQDLKETFPHSSSVSLFDLNTFIEAYIDDNHGSIVLGNIHALILLKDNEQFVFYVAGDKAKQNCTEVDTKKFGKVISIGSGQVSFTKEAERLDRYHLQTPTMASNEPIHAAIGFNLSLISQLHQIDSLTGRTILEYWGGGYEIVFYDVNEGKFKHLEKYTIVFWNINLGVSEGMTPYGVLHYDRCVEESIIYTHGQSGLNIFPVKDICDFSKRTITINTSDIDFNSEIITNLILVSREDKIVNIYNFYDRHNKEEPGAVFIDKSEGGELQVLCHSEITKSLDSSVRTIEERRS